eukprot:2254453-Amphidinium_carterae.1
MRSMSGLFASENRFAGTLPSRSVAGLRLFGVSFNDFEGKMSQTQCGHVLMSHSCHPLLDQTFPTIHHACSVERLIYSY